MKIVNKLILISLILLSANSCYRDIEDEITVTRDKSGKVKLKIVDLHNNPMDESTIDIYENSYPIMQGSTDSKGIYDIGKLLQGNYTCSITARKGKSVYKIEESIQVIAKGDYTLELNAVKNSGTFNVTVIDSETNAPIANPTDFKVALLVSPECYNVTSGDFLLENAHFTADLDNNANALIREIPLYEAYRFFLMNSKTQEYHAYIFYNIVNEGETRDIIIIKK